MGGLCFSLFEFLFDFVDDRIVVFVFVDGGLIVLLFIIEDVEVLLVGEHFFDNLEVVIKGLFLRFFLTHD